MEQLPFGGPSNCTLEQLPIGTAASPEMPTGNGANPGLPICNGANPGLPIGNAANPGLPRAQPIVEQSYEPVAKATTDGQRLMGLSARNAAAAVCSARLQDAERTPYRYDAYVTQTMMWLQMCRS